MKLVRFLMTLPNATSQPVTVELKNGDSVNGQILSCTPLMNLSMKNIKLVQPHRDPKLLQYMSVRGNQIRQVILPDELDVDGVLARSVVKIKGSGAGPGSKEVNGASKTRGRSTGTRGGRGGARGRARAF